MRKRRVFELRLLFVRVRTYIIILKIMLKIKKAEAVKIKIVMDGKINDVLMVKKCSAVMNKK